MINTTKLTQAFKALRSAGFIARQNFTCCSSCAGAQLSKDFGAMPTHKQARVKGAVFFHRQDGESLREGGDMCIRFGTVKPGDHRAEDAAIGGVAVEYLKAAGLAVDWDGDPARCIVVKDEDVEITTMRAECLVS